MRKLFLFALLLTLTTFCFADDRVSILDKSSNLLTPTFVGTSIITGQNEVVSSGTAVVVGTNTAIGSITLRANTSNMDNLYVASAAIVIGSSAKAYVLATSATVTLYVDNLTDIYVLSGAGGGPVSNGYSYIATV